MKYLRTGWRALEGAHTLIWLLGLLGVSGTTILAVLQQLTSPEYLVWVLIGQTLVWLLVVLWVVLYVGRRVEAADDDNAAAPVAVAGTGGAGGSGTIIGNRGTVIGGRGGRGGVEGIGGTGGGGFVQGDDAMIVGGDGGDCPSLDGRGGRGARSPIERMAGPTEFWKYGRGGDGSNDPEYDRRLALLVRVRREYIAQDPGAEVYVAAGIDDIPVTWVNKRLEELGEGWRVARGEAGYVLPPL